MAGTDSSLLFRRLLLNGFEVGKVAANPRKSRQGEIVTTMKPMSNL